MPRGYGSHAEYMQWVKGDADHRQRVIEEALHQAFSGFIETRRVDVIVFSGMSAIKLSKAIFAHPLVLKPLLASCNIAARAIERDLGIKNVDIVFASQEDESIENAARMLLSILGGSKK